MADTSLRCSRRSRATSSSVSIASTSRRCRPSCRSSSAGCPRPRSRWCRWRTTAPPRPPAPTTSRARPTARGPARSTSTPMTRSYRRAQAHCARSAGSRWESATSSAGRAGHSSTASDAGPGAAPARSRARSKNMDGYVGGAGRQDPAVPERRSIGPASRLDCARACSRGGWRQRGRQSPGRLVA